MTYNGKIAYRNQYPLGFGNGNRYANTEVPMSTLFTKPYFIVPLFVFSIFAALRYRVGVDCESYKDSFYEIVAFGELQRTQEIEIAFLYLTKFTLLFTNKHFLLFFILALLQISLYYSAFLRDRQVLCFLSIALILTGEYWSWMNGMRQIIASCAFVATIPLILKKKWVLFVICAFIASQMHRSALIIIPIGFAIYFCRNNILNKYIQLAIIAVCFLFMNKFNNITDLYIAMFGAQLGFNEAKIEGYFELEATEIAFGLRSYLLYGAYIIAVLFSDKMMKFYNSEKFNVCYNLFFVAISLFLLFYNNFTIQRILYYIMIFVPAVISYLLFYLYKTRKYNLTIFLITILLLLTRTLYNFYIESGKIMIECILYKFDI